ncbi:hypothetical protein PMAYCL1PPCAC_05513, partial [Pristionchus mayeri]
TLECALRRRGDLLRVAVRLGETSGGDDARLRGGSHVRPGLPRGSRDRRRQAGDPCVREGLSFDGGAAVVRLEELLLLLGARARGRRGLIFFWVHG